MADTDFLADLARSPLGNVSRDAVVVARGAAIEVLEHPFTAQLGVRLDPEPATIDAASAVLAVPLPRRPNGAAGSGARRALWLGPDEWLVVDLDAPDITRAGPTLPPGMTVVPLSGHRTLLEIRGRDARALLARGCPLDLDPRAFGPDACAQSLLARVDVIIFLLEADAFGILVRASFARYLVAWMADAINGLEANR